MNQTKVVLSKPVEVKYANGKEGTIQTAVGVNGNRFYLINDKDGNQTFVGSFDVMSKRYAFFRQFTEEELLSDLS